MTWAVVGIESRITARVDMPMGEYGMVSEGD